MSIEKCNFTAQKNNKTILTMKKTLLLLSLVAAFASNVSAQNYQAKTDTIWGRNSMQECDGKPTTLSWDLKSFENVVQKVPLYNYNMMNGNTHLVYFIRMPEGHNRAEITLTTPSGKTLDCDFALIDPITGDTLQHHRLVAGQAGKKQTVELMPDINIEQDGWFRFDLDIPDLKSSVERVDYIVFQRESRNIVTTPRIYSALATYLNGWRSTDPKAPSGEAYDMCYVEVYVPVESDILSTYYSTMNVIGGYMGIQTAIYQEPGTGAVDYSKEYQHNMIFSVWDNGDTDVTPNLPDYLKSGALDNDPDVEVSRFGSEGTGVNTMKKLGYGDKWWKPGHWVQMLCTARPEEIDVTLEDGSVIKYPNTIITAWYKMAEDSEWGYLASCRRSGESSYFDGWGSFLENWNSWGGQHTREMYMRNGYMRSLASHKWYHRNSITTGYYYDPKRLYSNLRDRRLDFSFGVSEDPETEGAFYMKAGGYFTVSDGINRTLTVPLNNDGVAADTINTARLLDRVTQAIIKDKSKEINSKISKANTTTKRKALAQEILATADKFNGYTSEDMQELREVYGDGETVDVAKLRTAMINLSKNCMPLKYGVVEKKVHISSFRAYQLYNLAGQGVVTATEVDGVKTLKAMSATVDDATDAAKEEVKVTDSNANWMLLHDEDNNSYYLFNIGQRKYLDMSKPGLLTDSPVTVDVSISSSNGRTGFIFRQNGKTLITQPSSDVATVTAGSADGSNSVFELRDNYVMTPTDAEVKAQFEFIDAMADLQNQIKVVPTHLALPDDVVGGFKNPDEKEELRVLYNNGNVATADAARVVSLLTTSERIDFDPENTLYKLRVSSGPYATRRPYVTLNEDLKYSIYAADGQPDQIFTIRQVAPTSNPTGMAKAAVNVAGGYQLITQGRGIKEVGETKSAVIESVSADEAAPLYFTDQGAYKFSIGGSENSSTSIASSTKNLLVGAASSATGQWYLEPVREFAVSTNATGFVENGLYVDFDVVLPEGLEAFIVEGVTADGIIKTKKLELDRIPAHTPILLKGEADTTYALSIFPGSGTPPTENLLQGTMLKKEGMTANGYLMLDLSGTVPVFRQVNATEITKTNSVYLVKEGQVPEAETLDIDLIPTGISSLTPDPSPKGEGSRYVYDVQGRRITKATKGIIVSDGKKAVRK